MQILQPELWSKKMSYFVGFAVEMLDSFGVEQAKGQPWVGVVLLNWVGKDGGFLRSLELAEQQAFGIDFR